ncbi:MAG: glycosyltransferase family 4 protein [Actinobacteria bacterium]|nr:glycosyltransferase family 4 protein [Actinomycetota bacterium]
MRLLVVTNDYPPRPGGIQQYLGNLAAAMDGEVRVLAPADDDRSPGVVRNRRRFMWPTRAVRRWVIAQVEEFRPDVVLYGAPYPLPTMGPRVRAATGVPYAVLCHGAEITLPAAFPITRQLLAGPLRKADARFAVSRFTQRRVERLTGEPVAYLGAGVDVEAFTPGPAPEGTPVVGCVSRFVPRKGHARVLESVAALRGEGIDVAALIVGRGRQEARLRRLAGRLGVPATFAVDVPWADLPGLYRSMTVFAMPCRSRWMGLEVEGLGLVFLEASAAGLPVLAGDSGGSPETVLPGVTGYVVATDRHLTEGIRTLLADPSLAAGMGAAGRERVVAEFTWEAVAARLAGALSGLGGTSSGRDAS